MSSSTMCCCSFFDYGFTIAISTDYKVISFGHSKFGAHGHKDYLIESPTEINNLNNIKSISCGSSHTICLDYDGNVFSFGKNNFGQLGVVGDFELSQIHIPQKINLPIIKQISCGADYTMCLTEDNKLYSFGDNYSGQLGLHHTNTCYIPTLIPDFNNIELIVCGGHHSICKTSDNEYYSCGYNEYGQLGQGNNNTSYSQFTKCNNWPDNIIDIKCGSYFSVLLTDTGNVYSFGNNSYSKIGIASFPTLVKDIPEIKRIACADLHSIFCDTDNTLWIFGSETVPYVEKYTNNFSDNEEEEDFLLDNINLEIERDYSKKHQREGIINYNKKKEEDILVDYTNLKIEQDYLIKHQIPGYIIDIAVGKSHTFVKTSNNKIYAFGSNSHSQLGIKTSEDNQLTPIQVLIGKEDIWCSMFGNSKAKSARK